jgi:hypothetical protein
MGTVVYFESRVPTDWEKTHLPVIIITGEEWNPTEEMLRPQRQSCESVEMRTIRSLRTTKEELTEVEEIERIPGMYNPKELCNRLISSD